MRQAKMDSDQTLVLSAHGRVVLHGTVAGRALVSHEPISFLGGVDPTTGLVVEPGHPLQGESVVGRVLIFPRGKGSTVGSYTILNLAHNGRSPLAMINNLCEPIVAVGAILADIPTVDQIDISSIRSDDLVRIDGDSVEVWRGGH